MGVASSFIGPIIGLLALRPHRRSMRANGGQIEPAGATAGKSFSGSNTLLEKIVSEYIATHDHISTALADREEVV